MMTEQMTTTGARLNHLLDALSFKAGRGRIPAFQQYLMENVDGLEQLKYSTVRSWFHLHAPPMRKLSAIVDQLHKDYSFNEDIGQIKAWWKLGGKSPFKTDTGIDEATSEKLKFLITSMVTQESGEDFKAFSSTSLNAVKNKAIELARDFANPNKIEVPMEYLRVFIAEELRKSNS